MWQRKLSKVNADMQATVESISPMVKEVQSFAWPPSTGIAMTLTSVVSKSVVAQHVCNMTDGLLPTLLDGGDDDDEVR